MRVSVSVRVSQLCLVIDKHRHGVALVEVRHAGLAGLAHAGAARQHLHVVQPEEKIFVKIKKYFFILSDFMESTTWSLGAPYTLRRNM